MDLELKINNDHKNSILYRETDRAKKNILSILKGEMQNHRKNINRELTNDDVLSIIKKTLKPINEYLSKNEPNDSEFYITSVKEKEVLEAYLPKMMSYEEIVAEMDLLQANNDNVSIGLVMKHFSNKNVDKNLVKQIFENR